MIQDIILSTAIITIFLIVFFAIVRTKTETTDLHTEQEKWRVFEKSLHLKTIIAISIIAIIAWFWNVDGGYHSEVSQLPSPSGTKAEHVETSKSKEEKPFRYKEFSKEFVK